MHALTNVTTTQHFWGRLADRYAATPVPDQSVYERKREIARDWLARTATILELGCGTGSTATALAPYVGHIPATDGSTRMIAIAREKASAAGISNVDVRQLAVEQVHADDSSRDAGLAHNLLHWLADWRGVLTAAHRTLKPGSVLITSTVCVSEGLSLLRPLAAPGRSLGLLPRLTVFGREAPEKAVDDAGFHIEPAWHTDSRRGVFHVARKPL